jgi:ligand-binding sensor domain-containing protein
MRLMSDVVNPPLRRMLPIMLRRSVAVAGFAAWISALFGGPYLVTTFGVDEGLPQSSVMDVAQTPDGYLWIGTLMGGISRFDGVRFVNFDLEGNAGRGPVSVNRLFVDAAGRLWVNSFSGVERYAEGRFVPEFQREELRLNALLRSDAHEVVFMISRLDRPCNFTG